MDYEVFEGRRGIEPLYHQPNYKPYYYEKLYNQLNTPFSPSIYQFLSNRSIRAVTSLMVTLPLLFTSAAANWNSSSS